MEKNILRYIVFISLSSFCGITLAVEAKKVVKKPLTLREQLTRVRAAARRLISKQPNTKDSIAQIEKIHGEIGALESKAGIPAVYQKFAAIRREACVEQQKNPQIQELLKKIKKIRSAMGEKVASEKKDIEDLTQTLQETDRETDQRRIQSAIGELEKVIKSKTARESAQITKLNRQIRELMKPLLDKSRPVLADLQKRYKKIEKNLAELDKKLSGLVDDVENGLSEKAQLILETLRERATRLQQKIALKNPCPDLSSKERDWVAYFV